MANDFAGRVLKPGSVIQTNPVELRVRRRPAGIQVTVIEAFGGRARVTPRTQRIELIAGESRPLWRKRSVERRCKTMAV